MMSCFIIESEKYIKCEYINFTLEEGINIKKIQFFREYFVVCFVSKCKQSL